MAILDKQSRIILLAGGEKSAILSALLSAGENIVAVLLPYSVQREDRYEKLKTLCSENNIPVFRPQKKQLTNTLKQLSADLLISAGYPHILTAEHLSLSRSNINIHPTLLPEYRGPATAWNVIADGKMESGVTVHFINEGMDTGDIIHQQKVALTNFDTVYSLMKKTTAIEADTLINGLNKLRAPGFKPIKQDESKASVYHGFRKPEDSEIDPTRSINDLYHFIRACDPERFPAYFVKDGEKVGIKLFRLNKSTNESDSI